MDAYPEHALSYFRRLHFRERQQLFRPEAIGILELDGKHVRYRQHAVEVVQGIVSDHLSVIDNDYAVAEALGFLHVVGGVDQRLAALLEGLEVVEDGMAALRVHAHGGLVEKQNLWVVEQRGSQVKAPLHPATKRCYLVLGSISEANQS